MYELLKLVFIDTETSSLYSKYGEILQLSALKVVGIKDGKMEVAKFNEFIAPSENIRIDEEAMRINQIPLEKCTADKTDVFTRFMEFCEGRKVVGYNVGYDIRYIMDDMDKIGLDCGRMFYNSIDVYKEVQNRRLPTINNKLTTIAEHFGADVSNAHDSSADCMLTMFVYMQLRGYNLHVNKRKQ